jgi:hypothetical protein
VLGSVTPRRFAECATLSDYLLNKKRPVAVDFESTAADPHEFLFYRTVSIFYRAGIYFTRSHGERGELLDKQLTPFATLSSTLS